MDLVNVHYLVNVHSYLEIEAIFLILNKLIYEYTFIKSKWMFNEKIKVYEHSNESFWMLATS